MIVYLDANIVIYLVEKNPAWVPKVTARLAALLSAGDELAVSDIARLECLIGPFVSGDAQVLADFTTFFNDPNLHIFPVSAAVCERAARIRAAGRYKALDALHLAAAVANGCGLFLTNDTQLGAFPAIPVEVLS